MTAPDAHCDVADELLSDSPDFRIIRSTSGCPAGDWGEPSEGRSFGLALPEVGAFRRRVDGVAHFVDRNTGFFRRQGEVSEVAHFNDEPHAGTIVDVTAAEVLDVFDELGDAGGPVLVTPQVAAAHRQLLAALTAPAVDAFDIEGRVFQLLAKSFEQRRSSVISRRASASSITGRRLVDAVCEQLHLAPCSTLVEVAASVHYSPFHVCRMFREVTGVSMSTYRTWLRVQEVLVRLAEGADDLAAVAAELGFSDHAHLTRTVVRQVGATPSEIRRRLCELAGGSLAVPRQVGPRSLPPGSGRRWLRAPRRLPRPRAG